MYATVGGLSHGLVTPLAAFLAACLGGALGLRCLTRSLRATGPWRAGWLALSSAAIGAGIWVAHSLAMMGFTVAHTAVDYNPLISFAGLGVAIVMVGTGIFIIGYRGITGAALFTGGTIAGLGVASMHYLAMAGIRLNGRLEYNTLIVTASVLIAVVPVTVALWATGRSSGLLWRAGAGAAMGIAGVGMHYVGMAAVRVWVYSSTAAASGDSEVKTLALMLIGPVLFLLLLLVVVLVDPRLAAAARGRDPGAATARRRLPVLPAQRIGRTEPRARPRARQNR
jgi:NO-binding membrane sensor protein with MHYT domain